MANSKSLVERVAAMEQKVTDINQKIDDDRDARKEFWKEIKDAVAATGTSAEAARVLMDIRITKLEEKIWYAAGGISVVLVLAEIFIKLLSK